MKNLFFKSVCCLYFSSTKLGNSVTVYITSAALVKKAFSMPQLQERPNWRSRAIIKDGSKDYGETRPAHFFDILKMRPAPPF